jgi:hypothetical protein
MEMRMQNEPISDGRRSMAQRAECVNLRRALQMVLFTIPLALLVAMDTRAIRAADDNIKHAAREKQHQLIGVLQSDAPPAEKAIACKQLAVYGDKEAVPALAPLLSDANLASWARIALEVIPGPAADEALRAAAGKLQGKLLVGVINSIGVRRDPKAVDGHCGPGAILGRRAGRRSFGDRSGLYPGRGTITG